jgi:hypothetical protein
MTMYNLYYQCDDKQTMSDHQNSSKIQSENSRSEDTYGDNCYLKKIEEYLTGNVGEEGG